MSPPTFNKTWITKDVRELSKIDIDAFKNDLTGGQGGGGPRPKIIFNVIFVEGRQSYQMLFTGSKNIDPSRIYRIFKIAKYIHTYNYLATARFTRDYLKNLNFNTKNLSSPTVFELET